LFLRWGGSFFGEVSLRFWGAGEGDWSVQVGFCDFLLAIGVFGYSGAGVMRAVRNLFLRGLERE
jgi:hypothetical protein